MAEDPCAVFRGLARTTWHTLGLCYRRSISLGEDAITSNLLVSIATRLNGEVVFADTRPSESTSGCDFELLIGSIAAGWHRYAIQAKRITVSDARYAKLKYGVGAKKVPQKDLLRAYSASRSAKPLYCFYNTLYPISSSENYGVSVAPLSVVDDALVARGRSNFHWIHDQSGVFPWHYLVCGGPASKGALPVARLSWNDLDACHSRGVPADIAEWLDRGSIRSSAPEAGRMDEDEADHHRVKAEFGSESSNQTAFGGDGDGDGNRKMHETMHPSRLLPAAVLKLDLAITENGSTKKGVREH